MSDRHPTRDEPSPVEPRAPAWPVAGGLPPAPPRRRWPWIVAVVVLLAVAATAAGVAWDQRSTAAEWRQRALALEEQRDEVAELSEELQRQVSEVVAVLELSEQDVALLEERIRALADEKAQAQDEATTVQVERDVFVDLSGRVSNAVEALDVCVTRLFDLLNDSVEAYNAAAAGEVVDVEPLNAAAASTTSFCNDARSAAANAAAAADQLLRR